MSLQNAGIADAIADWPRYGLDLPESLTARVERLEVARYIETDHPLIVDRTQLSEDPEGYIETVAVELATAEHRREVKSLVLDNLERDVVSTANGVAIGLIEQMQAQLDEVSERYSEAVLQLPEDLSPEALIAADTEVFAAFETARSAAEDLHRIDSWSATSFLPSHSTGYSPQDPAQRLLRPDDVGALFVIQSAQRRAAHNSAEQSLNPAWVEAVRLHIPFRI